MLIIHIRFPEYDRCSGDLRLTNMLRILARDHKVTLHILYKPANYLTQTENARYLSVLKMLGIEVRTGSLRTTLRRRSYDLVLIEFWYVARHRFDEIRGLQPDARIAIDTEHVYFYSEQFQPLALGQDSHSADLLARKDAELNTYAKAEDRKSVV